MQKLSNLMKSFTDTRILDVGTGNGNFIRVMTVLNDKYKSVVGIDLIEGAINLCNSSFSDERIKFMKMDALNMEFEDESFDIVSLSNSLHHLEDIEATLSEMERVLVPGGILLFCEMRNNNLSKSQKSHLQIHHFAAEVDREFNVTHHDTFSEKEILKTAEKLIEMAQINEVDYLYTIIIEDEMPTYTSIGSSS